MYIVLVVGSLIGMTPGVMAKGVSVSQMMLVEVEGDGMQKSLTELDE